MKYTEQLETTNPTIPDKPDKNIRDIIEGNENSIRLILNPDSEITEISDKAKSHEEKEKIDTGAKINQILAGLKKEVLSINRL
ncbi:MAG: hypothetical protein PHS49_02905 [Candidatus Gracilibacteria bacterium]|nr:hypothetical protein [Candidatus Gracilibacteria bacterium]